MTTRWLDETGGTRGAEYQAGYEEKAAAGEYLHGEADAVQRLRPEAGRLLDAGCGTGRIGIELASRGWHVTGIDNDASMLEQARLRAPGLSWLGDDLLDVDLGPVHDVVLLAGNVMIFLAPGTEAAVVARMAAQLRPGGLLVAGFRLAGGGLFTDDPDVPPPTDHGLALVDYDAHCAAAGLLLTTRWATWSGEDYDSGDYAVSVHQRPSRTPASARPAG